MPVITSNGIALVLYKAQEGIFCSDANSTAYRYPMTDAKIFDGPNGPAVECPLDGTTYDLRTGQVSQSISDLHNHSIGNPMVSEE